MWLPLLSLRAQHSHQGTREMCKREPWQRALIAGACWGLCWPFWPVLGRKGDVGAMSACSSQLGPLHFILLKIGDCRYFNSETFATHTSVLSSMILSATVSNWFYKTCLGKTERTVSPDCTKHRPVCPWGCPTHSFAFLEHEPLLNQWRNVLSLI